MERDERMERGRETGRGGMEEADGRGGEGEKGMEEAGEQGRRQGGGPMSVTVSPLSSFLMFVFLNMIP